MEDAFIQSDLEVGEHITLVSLQGHATSRSKQGRKEHKEMIF